MHRVVVLVVFAALAAPAAAQVVPLPAEGLNFQAPGFTIHTPGKPWLMQATFPHQSKDGSVEGQFPLRFGMSPASADNPIVATLGLGHSSTAIVDIGGLVLPVAGRDPKAVIAVLLDYSKKRAEQEARDDTRVHYISSEFSETALNGARCVRWEAKSEDRGVPHHEGEVYTLTIHRLMCSDPEFPAYTVRVDYSVRMAPGERPFGSDEAGFAVLNSLKFAPLGYRVTLIPVGSMPQLLAEADGAIWVAYGGPDGKVARIDPNTNAVSAVIPVGNVPVGIMADANGVWVANFQGGTVQHIDPKTNKVVATIKVAGKPESIASGAGSIWVTANGTGSVMRIDPMSGAVTEIPSVAKSPAGIVFSDGAVFVTDYDGDRIVRLDPATDKIVGTLAAARSSNVVIADGTHLWANGQGREPMVLRIDPAAPDAPVKFTKTIDYMPTGLALWHGKLWVANWAGASLSVLDPQNPCAEGVFMPAGGAPFGLLAAQGSLWVSVLGEGAVLRFDPE